MSDKLYENMTDDEIMGVVAPDPDQEPADTEELSGAGSTLEDTLDTYADISAGDQEDDGNDEEAGAAAEEADDDDSPAPAKAADAGLEGTLSLAPVTPKQSTPNNPTPPPTLDAVPDTKSTKAPTDPDDIKAAYDQIMAPFRANGREMQVESPEEVIRLMQHGANYTRKMQALAPNLKLMRMLENNKMLTPEKINYLIDLERKDPKAIQKFFKESNVDPLDIDVTSEPAYSPGNHSVSDQEMLFHEMLGEVTSTPTGKETVALVNSSWDKASKEAIYREPAVLQIINEQRNNGIYDRISAEVDRQRILGNLTNIPFIQAYKQVGDNLHAAGKLTLPAKPGETIGEFKRVLETRPSSVKRAAVNGDQAKAASSARSTPKPASKDFNPFAMSDEEIMAITTPRS
jgi:hypothetical protein